MIASHKGWIGALAVVSLVVVSLVAAVYALPTNLEAESGDTTENAITVSDSSASDSSAIKFGLTGISIPTAASVGPRCDTSTTVTASAALTTLRSTGYLSCVTVQGTFTLEGSDGINWVIEDVRFEGQTGLYVIRGYRGVGGIDAFEGTPEQRPILRYIEAVGGAVTSHGTCSAVLIGKDMVVENADITGCQDGIKAEGSLTVRYSWIHDNDLINYGTPDQSHSDGVQIVSGTGIVFHGNRFDAYSTYSSDSSVPTGEWDYASGMLQTGTVSGDIQATWTNNWFAGGRYTFRSAEDTNGFVVSYTVHNNRWLRYGTSTVLGRSDLPPHQYGPTASLGDIDFDCSNVWDDTDEPILGSCS